MGDTRASCAVGDTQASCTLGDMWALCAVGDTAVGDTVCGGGHAGVVRGGADALLCPFRLRSVLETERRRHSGVMDRPVSR